MESFTSSCKYTDFSSIFLALCRLEKSPAGASSLERKSQTDRSKDIGSRETKELIQDMIDTMEEYGGIGIAAPQIYESKSVASFELKLNPKLCR
jgi:peptide deformylase